MKNNIIAIFLLFGLNVSFANNNDFSVGKMQSIVNSNMEFNSAKEIVKFKPENMTTEMKNLYDKYRNNDTYSGFELAKIFYKKGRYTDAGEILTEVITSNTVPPEAFTMLGDLFIYGKGVDKDCMKGGMFYMGGISAGDCSAFGRMSKQYSTGVCVGNRDLKKSRKYFLMENKCIEDKKNGVVHAKKVGNKMIIEKKNKGSQQ